MAKSSWLALTAIAACSPLLAAQSATRQPSAGAPQKIKVCSLLPKEEVKKHLPWNAVVDRMEPEEEAIGPSGSSCNYPSVFIQVLPGTKTAGPPSQNGGYEAIAGVGDEAYFRNNRIATRSCT
jgi:hypothetical protein